MMNSIQLTSKKINELAREISLALILRNYEISHNTAEMLKLLSELNNLFGISTISETFLDKFQDKEKLFEILSNPDNALTFSEGLGRKANLNIFIVGESELRYSINLINPNLNAIRDYQNFVNESQKYAYTFLFQDSINEKSLKNINFKVIQEIMLGLNVWQGEIEIFGGVQSGIFIEDNSNNSSKEFFKTIIQSVKIQAALTPYTKNSEGTAISTKISYKADLNLNLITDIFKNGTMVKNISVDISFDDKNSVNKFSALRNYSTKVGEKNHIYNDVYELMFKLLRS